MPDLKKLIRLRQLLVEATDFSDVYSYFMDHFGKSPELMSLGKPLRDTTFLAVLEQIGSQVIGKKARISRPLLLRVPEHTFIHGAFRLGDHLGSVLYFEDIKMGLAAFGGLESEGPSQFMRFSLVEHPRGKQLTLS
jgi:hypothetical protein